MRFVMLVWVIVAVPLGVSAQNPVPVAVMRPAMQRLARIVEQPGTLRADLESPISAKLSGYVAKVHVDLGDRIKANQVLAEVSVPELDEEARMKQAQVKQAAVAIEQAKAIRLTLDAVIRTAEANVHEAEAGMARADAVVARWKAEEARASTLMKKGLMDAQNYDEALKQLRVADSSRDEAKARVATATAQLQRTKADRQKAEVDILVEEAKYEVAKADAARTTALLEYKTLRAPFDGVVTRRLVDPGILLTGGKPEPLLILARIDRLRVLIDVPEVDAATIQPGAAAKIRFPAMTNREYLAKVSRTAWSLDPQARTLRVEVDLPNADGALRPGMYVNSTISVELPSVPTIPNKALVKAGDTMACFLVRDGKAVRLRVKVGRSDGQRTELVQKQGASGAWVPIDGDEEIIAAPPTNLQDGDPVKVEK